MKIPQNSRFSLPNFCKISAKFLLNSAEFLQNQRINLAVIAMNPIILQFVRQPTKAISR